MDKTERIVTRVNKDLKDKLISKCESEHTSVSQKIRDLINQWVKK